MMCLFHSCLPGLIKREGQDRSVAGRGGGREEESARHERRMKSVRGTVHLTSGRARSRMQQSCFCFSVHVFLCSVQDIQNLN